MGEDVEMKESDSVENESGGSNPNDHLKATQSINNDSIVESTEKEKGSETTAATTTTTMTVSEPQIEDSLEPENAPIDSNKFYEKDFYTEENILEGAEKHASERFGIKGKFKSKTNKTVEEDEYSYLFDEEDLSSDMGEQLVPIRLDIALQNGAHLLDTFNWNLGEASILPEDFARGLCIDLDLPNHVESLIVESIYEQLQLFKVYTPPAKIESAEFLVLIRLDITINGINVKDQFEWDLSNTESSPEIFARTLCQDLGLFREFEVAISHSIREQLAYYTNIQPQHHHRRAAKAVDRIGARPTITPQTAIRDEKDLHMWTPYVGNSTQNKMPNNTNNPAFPNQTIPTPASTQNVRAVRQSARLLSTPNSYQKPPISP